MAHFVGLDVSVKETSVCVVDDAGKVVVEQKVPTEPADLIALLTSLGVSYDRIGIEAGPLSQWLVSALIDAELPVICVETQHMKALLAAQQINKTDRNDARGIAQMMRVGLFKPVHVKTLVAQEQRMLLTSRKLLQRKLLDLECELRGTLRNFGLKVGVVSGSRYEARVRELVSGFPRLAAIAEPLLSVRQVMRQQLAVLLRQKNVLTGTTGGVSSQGPPILPPISGKGARQIVSPHPWRGVQMWRRPAAHNALRSRAGTAYPRQ